MPKKPIIIGVTGGSGGVRPVFLVPFYPIFQMRKLP